MKFIRLFCLFFLFSVLFTSCKKEETPLENYRNQFIGSYYCEWRTITWSANGAPTDTTYTFFQGEVTKNENNPKGLIINTGSEELNVDVEFDGVISYCLVSNAGIFTQTEFICEISSESCGMGPNGWISEYKITGVKQ